MSIKIIAERLRAADELEQDTSKQFAAEREVLDAVLKALRSVRATGDMNGYGQAQVTLGRKVHFATVLCLLGKGRVTPIFAPAVGAYKGSVEGEFTGVKVRVMYDAKGICTCIDVLTP